MAVALLGVYRRLSFAFFVFVVGCVAVYNGLTERERMSSLVDVTVTERNHEPIAAKETNSETTLAATTADREMYLRTRRITILLWNTHYGIEDYEFGLGHEGFVRHNCAFTNCYLTTDRTMLEEADAVFVHTADILPDDFPTRSRTDQIWISFNMKNPLRNWWRLPPMTDMFNLTFSYLNHPETDIYTPLGGVLPRLDDQPYELPSEAFVRNKTKMVAWVVSNCKPHSLRNQYADQLAKHVTVDVFGLCSNKSCEGYDCFKNIERDYFFYLAFENGFCRDYMTEKVFRTLKFDIIPVVLGGGNYSAILPARSYIDVRDFNSPKHLAETLVRISKNTKEYLSYFDWKKNFVPIISPVTRPWGFCKLCEILNDKSYRFKSGFNMSAYWDAGRWCLKGETESKALHL